MNDSNQVTTTSFGTLQLWGFLVVVVFLIGKSPQTTCFFPILFSLFGSTVVVIQSLEYRWSVSDEARWVDALYSVIDGILVSLLFFLPAVFFPKRYSRAPDKARQYASGTKKRSLCSCTAAAAYVTIVGSLKFLDLGIERYMGHGFHNEEASILIKNLGDREGLNMIGGDAYIFTATFLTCSIITTAAGLFIVSSTGMMKTTEKASIPVTTAGLYIVSRTKRTFTPSTCFSIQSSRVNDSWSKRKHSLLLFACFLCLYLAWLIDDRFWSPVFCPAINLVTVAIIQPILAQLSPKSITYSKREQSFNAEVLATSAANDTEEQQQQQQQQPRRRPNVLLMIHESLGRKYIFERPGLGEEAMPFFHQTFRKDPDVYDFQHARTISPRTQNAVPSIFSGRIIQGPREAEQSYDDGLTSIPHLSAMAKAANYTPVIYSSGPTFKNDHELRFNKFLNDGFDRVYSIDTLNETRVNEYGMDDRILTRTIKEHFNEGRYDDGNGGVGPDGRPFFIIIMYNNMHVPFLINEKTYKGREKKRHMEKDDFWREMNHDRYMSALEITDDMLKQVYEMFQERKLLDNTVLSFTADHGEHAHDTRFRRLTQPDTEIMSIPFYLRLPPPILRNVQEQPEQQPSTSSEKAATAKTGLANKAVVETLQARLRANTDRLVSNLDLYPTITHLVRGYGHPSDVSRYDTINVDERSYGIKTGQSLLNGIIPTDRIVYGYAGPPYSHAGRGIVAVMTKDCNVFFWVGSRRAWHVCVDPDTPGYVRDGTKRKNLVRMANDGNKDTQAIVQGVRDALEQVPAIEAYVHHYFPFMQKETNT